MHKSIRFNDPLFKKAALLIICVLLIVCPVKDSYGLSIKSIYMNVRNLFKITNIENIAEKDSKELYINQFKFSNLETPEDFIIAQASGLNIDLDKDIEAAVLGMPLFYPNPFRQTEGGTIGYRLSKDLEIELHIYDMFANRIFKNIFPRGRMGGKKGYNKLKLNLETFDSHYLSAGVYFYLLVNKGKVLEKGKMAIVP
ncbi:hypothetical protein ACFLZV_01890 [Candidatus Margulisiibacteriota bacterium]